MELIIILVCLSLNAILAAVEMSFVTVAKARLRELAKGGSADAKRVLRLRESPERTLSVIQIGISTVGALAAATGGVGAGSVIQPFLRTHLGLEGKLPEIIALALVVLPYTYLSVVIGELVPKAVAMRSPWQIVRVASRYFGFFERLFAPVVSLLEVSTQFILHLLRPRWRWGKGSYDEGEAIDLARLSHHTRESVLNLIELDQTRVGDLAIPWQKVEFIERRHTMAEVDRHIHLLGHTRLPVVEGGQVIGFLHTKEFGLYRKSGGDMWRRLIRPILFLEESAHAMAALRVMQERRTQMSIVLREGQCVGLVTLEDILEQVVGPIFDEDDGVDAGGWATKALAFEKTASSLNKS